MYGWQQCFCEWHESFVGIIICAEDAGQRLQIKIKMEDNLWPHVDYVVFVGVRRAGASLSKPADLLWFSHAPVRVSSFSQGFLHRSTMGTKWYWQINEKKVKKKRNFNKINGLSLHWLLHYKHNRYLHWIIRAGIQQKHVYHTSRCEPERPALGKSHGGVIREDGQTLSFLRCG